jgi:uncharacterized membrane protein HdeD (DUF308 family)
MKASRIITIILGILMIGTGIYCLCTPALTYMALGYIVGVNMVIDAIGGIILWHERKKAGDADGWALAGAVASLVFGVILTCSTAFQWIVDLAIVYLAAIWIIVIGILRIVHAVRVHKLRKALDAEILGSRWWLVLIVGILMVVCGVFSLFNPSGLIIAIGVNFGLNIIIAGANLIAVAA